VILRVPQHGIRTTEIHTRRVDQPASWWSVTVIWLAVTSRQRQQLCQQVTTSMQRWHQAAQLELLPQYQHNEGVWHTLRATGTAERTEWLRCGCGVCGVPAEWLARLTPYIPCQAQAARAAQSPTKYENTNVVLLKRFGDYVRLNMAPSDWHAAAPAQQCSGSEPQLRQHCSLPLQQSCCNGSIMTQVVVSFGKALQQKLSIQRQLPLRHVLAAT